MVECSRHEQLCLIRLRFKRDFSHPLKRSLIKHTCSWRDKLIILQTLNRQAKIFSSRSSVRLLTKWLWVRIPLLSLKLQIWRLPRARSSLTFRLTIEWGFTLKSVRDMIMTYSHFCVFIVNFELVNVGWETWLDSRFSLTITYIIF